MTALADPAHGPEPTPNGAWHRLCLELASATVASQAAVLRGSFQELEAATAARQEICAKIQSFNESLSADEPNFARAAAEQARWQNLVLAATIRRRQRHLGSLVGVLAGLSPTYSSAISDRGM